MLTRWQVAVALGVKAAMEKHNISGKILLLGTPAEEGGAGKAILIEKGAYEEMDICLMCHPGPGPQKGAGTGPSLAITGYTVEFTGHTYVALYQLHNCITSSRRRRSSFCSR